MRNLLFILLAIFTVGCCSCPKPTSEYDISSGNYFITYRGSACYGKCPEFNLKLENNGKVIYTGINNTKMQGIYVTTISEKQINELFASLEKGKFFTLLDKYDEYVTDLPYVSIGVKINEKNKLVVYRNFPPDGLKDVADFFNKLIANTSVWTKEEK